MDKATCDSLLSVGIDIGTTTTHLIVSRLTLADSTKVNQTPRLVIESRHILYSSPVFQTPLSDHGVIDESGVAEIVRQEYDKAGVVAEDIDSGAVIITGETSYLRNAPAVAHALAESAGSFVVASAGPHLESVLAGRGSGAAYESLKTGMTIANIDIGGGTTNIAVFRRGEVIDTACLGIGGRCLRMNTELEVVGITESGELFFDAVAKPVSPGEKLDSEKLFLYGSLLCQCILQTITTRKPGQLVRRLLISEPLELNYSIDQFWFSGGVGALVDNPPANLNQFGDMGPWLSAGLAGCMEENSLPYRVARDSIRATVIGAGSHNLQLTGSTIQTCKDSLPLRNLPLVRPGRLDKSGCSESLASSLVNQDLQNADRPLAIVLEPMESISYGIVESLSDRLAQALIQNRVPEPYVIVTGQDVAMALGQQLRKRLKNKRLVVLDGIETSHGDYIDVGMPVKNGKAIPVTVKSLVFKV